MTLENAISIINDSIDYLPTKSIEAVNMICSLAIQNEQNKKQNTHLKKQIDILARKLANELKISISSVRGRILFEIEESEKQ